MRFIVDLNVGKLAKWLRIIGYDTLFIRGIDDDGLVRTGLEEGRVVLTKDTQILKRRVVTSGQLKVIYIRDTEVKAQLKQVVQELNLPLRPFTLCIECNLPLEPRTKEEVAELVPPYVFRTQSQYVQCPSCRRVYWRGTHWERMTGELQGLGVGDE